MKNDLISSIAKQLNIEPYAASDWICQVIYSATAQMALASLWESGEEGSSVSIQHFKGRAEQILNAFLDIYPETRALFSENQTLIIEDIYSTYLHCGFFYHSANHMAPVAFSASRFNNMSLIRGFSPEIVMKMSGLGFYATHPYDHNKTVSEMFGLQIQPFEDYLSEMLASGQWENVDFPEDVEFLRLDPPFSRGYWQKTTEKYGRLSIVRYGAPQKTFAFYRIINTKFQQMIIPDWRLKDYFSNANGNYEEYRRIAIALLKRYDTLPPISIKDNGYQILIKLGYRLPPSEENFFKLFTWPQRYSFDAESPQVFTRIMSKQVFPMFKYTLEQLGYQFEEDTK